MSVWIAQLKCPSNHAVLAAAGECADEAAARALQLTLEAAFAEMVAEGKLNPECGLCHSTDLRVSVGKTGYQTMDEAWPHLKESERQQEAVRAILKDSKN